MNFKKTIWILIIILLGFFIVGCLNKQERAAYKLIDEINKSANLNNQSLENIEEKDKEITNEESEIKALCIEFDEAPNITENRKIIYQIEDKLDSLKKKSKKTAEEAQDLKKSYLDIKKNWQELQEIEAPQWITTYSKYHLDSLEYRTKAVDMLIDSYQTSDDFYKESEAFFISLDKILIEMKNVKFEDEEQRNNFFNQRMKPHSKNYKLHMESKADYLTKVTANFDKAENLQDKATKLYDKNF